MGKRSKARATDVEAGAKRLKNLDAANKYSTGPKGRVRAQSFAGAMKFVTKLTELGGVQDASPSTRAKDAEKQRELRGALAKLFEAMPDVGSQFAIDDSSPRQLQIANGARMSHVEPRRSASALTDHCMKNPGACDREDGHDSKCNTRLVEHEDIEPVRPYKEIGAKVLDPMFNALYKRFQYFEFEHKLIVFELAERGYIKIPEAYHTRYPTTDVSGAGVTNTPDLRKLNAKIMNRKANWKSQWGARQPKVVQHFQIVGGTNQIAGVNDGEMKQAHVSFGCGEATFKAAKQMFACGGSNSRGR